MWNESFYITEKEFYFLCAGKGLREWSGIILNQERNFLNSITREEIYRMMIQLYQKEYITWKNKKILILEPINSMINIVIQSRYYLIVKKNDMKLWTFYSNGEQILMVENSQREFDKLRLTIFHHREFFDVLEEKECIPKNEILEEKFLLDQGEQRVLTIFELRETQSGDIRKKIKIKEQGMKNHIEIEGLKKEYIYKKGKLYQEIRLFIEKERA